MRCFLIALALAGVAAMPPANLRATIDAWVQRNQKALVASLVELLAIPNVAADRQNIRRNATWLRDYLAKRGVAAEILETTESTVRNHILHARRALREGLRTRFPEYWQKSTRR